MGLRPGRRTARRRCRQPLLLRRAQRRGVPPGARRHDRCRRAEAPWRRRHRAARRRRGRRVGTQHLPRARRREPRRVRPRPNRHQRPLRGLGRPHPVRHAAGRPLRRRRAHRGLARPASAGASKERVPPSRSTATSASATASASRPTARSSTTPTRAPTPCGPTTTTPPGSPPTVAHWSSTYGLWPDGLAVDEAGTVWIADFSAARGGGGSGPTGGSGVGSRSRPRSDQPVLRWRQPPRPLHRDRRQHRRHRPGRQRLPHQGRHARRARSPRPGLTVDGRCPSAANSTPVT